MGRGVSRVAATSKMERFVIIVKDWKPLTIITKRFIMDVAAALDSPLIGAFDKAEVCEAVGNFLFYQLSKNYNKKDIGLYRDDGLAIFKNVSGSTAEKIKKDIQKLFKDNHLNITVQCNLKMSTISMSLSIFLMLRTDHFASPTTKSHIYIKNQTTHHLF